MPPRKKARTDGSSSEVVDVANLCGGHAEKPGTIAKFRACSHCDVELHAGDGSARKAHRVVLMSSSAYFEAAWSETWNDLSTLTVPALSGTALDHCLEFMYTGECRVNAGVLPDVLDAAAYFQMEVLASAASEALQMRLGPANCLEIWQLADRHTIPAMAAAAIKVAGHHFSDVASGPSWLAAPHAVVRALLNEDEVAATEVEVYDAAMHWLRGRSPPIGEEQTIQVLSSIRFARLPLHFVTGTVEAEPLLCSFAGRDMLAKAFRDRAYGVDSAATRARALARPTGLLAIAGGPLTCERFVLSRNTWEKLAAPPAGIGRVGVTAVRANRQVYVLGADTKEVWRLDPTTMTWSPAPPMRLSCRSPGVGVIDDKIYVVSGGYDFADTETSNRRIDRFDTLADSWSTLGLMSIKRESPAVAAGAGQLDVMGGCGFRERDSDDSGDSSRDSDDDDDNRPSLDSAECFDPATGRWSSIARMPTAKYNAGVAVLDGLIYVAGGSTDAGTVRCMHRYDPRSDRWDACRKMKRRRWEPGMAVLDGNIYVAGGNDGGEDKVERYDPMTNKWEDVPAMTEHRSMFPLIPI
jgi:N-acetylneuraminic acid mutarotase